MGNNATGGVVRAISAAAVGYVVAKGWVSEGVANEIAGAVGVLIVSIWSGISKKSS